MLVPSCQRAIVHNRSDRRLRYGTTSDGAAAAAKRVTLGAAHDGATEIEPCGHRIASGHHELGRMRELLVQFVDHRFEVGDHLGGDCRRAGLQLRSIVGQRRQLGHQHVQISHQRHQQLVDRRTGTGVRPRQTPAPPAPRRPCHRQWATRCPWRPCRRRTDRWCRRRPSSCRCARVSPRHATERAGPAVLTEFTPDLCALPTTR